MPHIHTKPGQHDHTASGFIVRLDLDEPQMLLHRHRLLDKYLQFGGHIELDETPWQTIIHELQEESGYTMEQLKILQPKMRLKRLTRSKLHPQPVTVDTHNFSPDHFHTDMKYVFVTRELPSLKVGPDESTDFKLFTKAKLMELSEDETFKDVKEIGEYIFDHILPTWQPVDPSEFRI